MRTGVRIMDAGRSRWQPACTHYVASLHPPASDVRQQHSISTKIGRMRSASVHGCVCMSDRVVHAHERRAHIKH